MMCDDKKQKMRLLAAQKRIEIRIGRPLFRDERKRVATLLEERDPLAARWAIWLYCNRRKISAIIWAGRLDHMVKSICYEMGDMMPAWRYFGPVRFGVYSDLDRLADRASAEKFAIMLPDDYAKQTEYALHVHRDIEKDGTS